MKSKMFSEVHNELTYSINIYRGSDEEPDLINISNAFIPSQVDESFIHDGTGPLGSLKTEAGKWNTSGHRDRVVRIGVDELRAMAELSGDEQEFIKTRFIQPFAKSEISALRKFSEAAKKFTGSMDLQLSGMWDEAAAQKNGTIKKGTDFRGTPENTIYSGTAIHVGNPLYKTPRRGCKSNKDFEYFDLATISNDYLPRSNFCPAVDLSDYRQQLPASRFAPGRSHSSHFRLAVRAMVALNGERSLISCIFPPGLGHISGIGSIACRDSSHLLHLASAFQSVPFDFLIKATGQANFRQSTLDSMPRIEVCGTAMSRTLRLNCLTSAYSELWDKFATAHEVLPWSSSDPRLRIEGPVEGPIIWDRTAGLRTEFRPPHGAGRDRRACRAGARPDPRPADRDLPDLFPGPSGERGRHLVRPERPDRLDLLQGPARRWLARRDAAKAPAAPLGRRSSPTTRRN